MPELPEVETIVRTLGPRLQSAVIEAVYLSRKDFVHPSELDLAARLSSRRVTRVSRRAKRIVFRLDDGNCFYIHLGMSGRLGMEPIEAQRRPHTHLALQFGGQELRLVDPRRFGGVFWMGSGENGDENLGPEPLGLRAGELGKRLERTTRAIKNALLDQSVVAGLGNIYVDESLFEAGIHPLWPANRLSAQQVGKLNRAIKTVLRRALRPRGSTLRDYRDADGEPGNFQKLHRAYDREGQPCMNCGTKIQRIVLGGRSTHFCPKCQRSRSSRQIMSS